MPTTTRHGFNGAAASGMGMFGIKGDGTFLTPSQSVPGIVIHTCPAGAVDIVSLRGKRTGSNSQNVWISGANTPNPFSGKGALPINLIRPILDTIHATDMLADADGPGSLTMFAGDKLYIKYTDTTDEHLTLLGHVDRITGQ